MNSLALKLVGITAESGDPPDGLIDRDLETGEPTGILFGMGNYLAKKIPALDDERNETRGATCKRGTPLVSELHQFRMPHLIMIYSSWNMMRQWRSEIFSDPQSQ